MKKIAHLLLTLLVALQISGCAGLAEMRKVDFSTSVAPDTALVNIVRPRVFMGDGAKVEMWDGDKFVGTLTAGSMIQYRVAPGEHIFMAYTQGSWGIAKGELVAGKTYYLKFNVGFGFVTLGAAKSDDPRIKIWNTELTPMAIDPVASKPVPAQEVRAAQSMLDRVQMNTATYELISDQNAI